MATAQTENPKTFISYSWSSSEHEQWVIDLATQLTESGVEVILDKWELREGADKYAFMEKMVTDVSVKKVVVVCDRLYAEKADGREGGVGTETQIISQELYSQVDATDQKQKFVAVITEKNVEGNPYVPTFLKSRIYIDMSDTSEYSMGMENLLRWIYDKPLHQKPKIGKPPTYLTTDNQITLGTTSRFRHALEALKQGKSGSLEALIDYFDTYSENIESLRIQKDQEKQFDDQVLESIENFLPFRNEIIEIFIAVSKYMATADGFQAIHRFFEKVLPYGYWPAGKSSWTDGNADNLAFIVQELFLHAIAILIKYERFEGVRELTEQEYFFPPGCPVVKTGMVPFFLFRHFFRSLKRRNERLNLQRISLGADFLEKRSKTAIIKFEELMQADFVLFLWADLHPIEGEWRSNRWWPETLVYAEDFHGSFEIFSRAQSKRYFEKLRIALGINSRDEIVALLEKYNQKTIKIPSFGHFSTFDPGTLINIERLNTRP